MVGKTHDESVDGGDEGGGKKIFGKLREKLKDTHLYDLKVGAIHAKHRVGKLENL